VTRYPEIHLRKSASGYDEWEVIESVKCPEGVVIPKGFVTDFASVPQALWWLLPPYGKAATAAVLHDYRYVSAWGSQQTSPYRARLQADLYFYRDMVEGGVMSWQAWLMYQAVRWFGARHWKKRAKQIQHTP
jgi:hypothetical protein